MDTVLEINKISKRFGSLVANDSVSLKLGKGEILALLGENGAGKTTLMNIIYGHYTADSGKINVLGKNLSGGKPREAIEAGIGMVHQHFSLAGNLTVLENVMIGSESLFKRSSDKQFAKDKLLSISEKFGLPVSPGALISSLSVGERQRVEILKALYRNAKILILDEPTNHLDLEMIEWLEKFLVSEKLTLLMVTHDRYFLENVCNVILEMDDRGLYTYKGNYSYFLEKREERKQIEQSGIEKAKNLYRKELDWMRRQPKARSTKSKARIDSFYGVEEQAKKRTDEKEVELEFNMERLGSKILEFHNISKSFGDKVLFHGFSYKFQRGEKIGIIGPNGAGKSSFLYLVTKRLIHE
jgi:ATP-binding cassette subfamily F protein uup